MFGGAMRTEDRLFSYLDSERVHPALLLVGPDRDSKLRIGKALGQRLLCASPLRGRPCGNCSACRRVEKELHPDFLILRDEDDENLKIDSVRDLCHQMSIAPLEGRMKICLIDECHRMNAAAANAFLKTLEEPGEGRHFILLTTQPGSLLPTILSRCLQFTLPPAAPEANFAASEEVVTAFTEFLKNKSLTGLLSALSEKDQCLELLRYLQSQLRDSLLAPSLGRPLPAAFASQSEFWRLSCFEEALGLEGKLRSNANYGLLLEAFLRRFFPK